METELNQEGLKASQISVTFLWPGSEKQLTYNQVPYRNDLLEHLFQRHPAAQPARLAQKGHRKPAVAGIGLGAELVTEIFGTLLIMFQKGLFIRTRRWVVCFQTTVVLNYYCNTQEGLEDLKQQGFSSRQLKDVPITFF